MKNYIERKSIKNILAKKLSPEETEQAKGDIHAWREKCTSILPIISGQDCPFGCIYCYIQSMGFSFTKPKPLNLSGEQICYALLENKEFVIGKYGTPLAFGHISEPFLPVLLKNTLEYFKAISTYLGNPIQFATKSYINSPMIKKIKSALGNKSKQKLISPLVTITTLSHHKKLEPNAPPPGKRFKSISSLSKAGFKVFLYLRPLIPGVVDNEIEDILKKAKKSGACGVVAGGFRITLPILNKMKETGIDVSEIANRSPKIDKTQRYIYTKDLEDKCIKIARDLKLITVRSTKCAMAYSCKVPAPSLYWIYNKDLCTKCKPCYREKPKYKKTEVKSILKEILYDEQIISYNDTNEALQINSTFSNLTDKNYNESNAQINKKQTKKDFAKKWKPRVLETYFRKQVTISRKD